MNHTEDRLSADINAAQAQQTAFQVLPPAPSPSPAAGEPCALPSPLLQR